MEKNKIEEVEFLQVIYKNSDMGIIDIDNIITKVKDENLEKILNEEKNEYNKICREAEVILKKYGKSNEEIGILSKLNSALVSEIAMLKDNSVTGIAKLMIDGTNKGIIEITEKINSYDGKDAEIVVLATKLKNIEEKNIEELKKFL